jgi:hypothetical protein
MRVRIYGRDLRTAMRQFKAVETGIAADIQRPPARQVLREMRGDLLPFVARKIAEPVVGHRLTAIGQMQVVEPGFQFLDSPLHLRHASVRSSFPSIDADGLVLRAHSCSALPCDMNAVNAPGTRPA